MIKLIVNPDSETSSFSFDQTEILIGKEGCSQVDLGLTGDVQDVHLKITQEPSGKFSLQNIANDPFATINGLPFGKRFLKNSDRLQIGDNTILIELLPTGYQHLPKATLQEIDPLVDHAIKAKEDELKILAFINENKEPEKNPPEIEEDVSNPPLMTSEEIKSLFTELEEINDETYEQVEEEQIETTQSDKPPPKPIKILDISDQADETPDEKENPKAAERITLPQFLRNFFARTSLRLFFGIIVSILAIFLIIGGSIYNTISTKQHQDEMEAARGVADIALSLVHAQVNHIHPRLQNWSDPQFLKSSLDSVLSPHHPPAATLDSLGKLNGKYLLRIYTSKDSSRFILIAQPESTFFPWSSMADAIVLDSHAMTLRKIHDIRALNRLLINPDSLSPEGHDELASLIGQGQLISSEELADSGNKNGFSTPPELSDICEDATNLIYNCPRYSQMGTKLMEKAIELVKDPNLTDLKKLHEELKLIAKFKDPILYTTKGLRAAIEAKEAISNLMPKTKFMIAYLDYDPKDERTVSKVLIEQGQPEKKALPLAIGSHKPLEVISKAISLSDVQKPSGLVQEIDRENPLYHKLTELVNERWLTLQPLGIALIEVIQAQINEEMVDFSSSFESLADQFLEKSMLQREALLQNLYALYQAEKDISLAEFLAFVEASGLKNLAESHLLEMVQNQSEEIEPHLLEQIGKILETTNLQELHDQVELIAHLFKQNDSRDPYQVLTGQNLVRNKVQEKILTFLLSPIGKLPKNDFTPEGKELLKLILKKGWIFDAEERDYFLGEYQLLVDENLKS